MADNVPITAGSGTTIAADEVVDGTLGTVKAQYVKLMDGTLDGTAKAKILAASTAAVAADPSIVVALSPNSRVIYRGISGTFRTPGRAGSTGQTLLTLYNAGGSTVKVRILGFRVDLYVTVVKAVTVPPPIIRVKKTVSNSPSNGVALEKNQIGGSGSSSSSVTLLQDASADGTAATTALVGGGATAAPFVGQAFAHRVITAVGFETQHRHFFEFGRGIEFTGSDGIQVRLEYTNVASNPITDMWVVDVEWEEE